MINEAYFSAAHELLGDAYNDYVELLDKEPYRGFRINTLKISQEEFRQRFSYALRKSPFAANGYYTNVPAGIGYTPAYREGLFYMQEPSASAPVTVLNVQRGMKVLDLCAAPGSKSTQIAEALGNEGLLVANEAVSNRSDILVENIERNGAANVVILNASTADIADAFPSFFDAVLVDAPCSGEGMFRKNHEALQQWSEEEVRLCALRQKEILADAYKVLNDGGIMVYSTCTFSVEENEKMTAAFLKEHPDMHICEPDVSFGRNGIDCSMGTGHSIRIYPMDGGEGQFMVRMQKDGVKKNVHMKTMHSDSIPDFVNQFLKDMLVKQYPYYLLKRERLYGGAYPFIDCAGCRIKRAQVYLGEIKGNRFEPSYNFFTSSWSDFRHKVELNEEDVLHYLHGEEIHLASPKGWTALCDQGHPIGGGKSDGKVIKNKYPKAFRIR